MEDKFDKVYTRFMDSVLELAIELSETDTEDLTDKEIEFLNSFDDYIDEITEEDELN
jgi:hypothetical protein